MQIIATNIAIITISILCLWFLSGVIFLLFCEHKALTIISKEDIWEERYKLDLKFKSVGVEDELKSAMLFRNPYPKELR